MVRDKTVLYSLTMVFFLVVSSVYLYALEGVNGTVVVIETELGEIHIEVYTDRAPLSSASFLAHIDQGFLSFNCGFYRAIRKDNDRRIVPHIELIQGGMLELSKALPSIAHESTIETGLSHQDGAISLARGELGTARGGTFFICIGDQSSLDFGGRRAIKINQTLGYDYDQGFAVFGKVISGMDVVRKIQKIETVEWPRGNTSIPNQRLDPPIKITRAYRR